MTTPTPTNHSATSNGAASSKIDDDKSSQAFSMFVSDMLSQMVRTSDAVWFGAVRCNFFAWSRHCLFHSDTLFPFRFVSFSFCSCVGDANIRIPACYTHICIHMYIHTYITPTHRPHSNNQQEEDFQRSGDSIMDRMREMGSKMDGLEQSKSGAKAEYRLHPNPSIASIHVIYWQCLFFLFLVRSLFSQVFLVWCKKPDSTKRRTRTRRVPTKRTTPNKRRGIPLLPRRQTGDHRRIRLRPTTRRKEFSCNE